MLTITKDSKLIKNYKQVHQLDVTEFSFAYILNYVVLEEGVTLRNILDIVKINKEFYAMIMPNNFVEEYLEEAYKEGAARPTDLVRLELSHNFDFTNKSVFMERRPYFDGVCAEENSTYAIDFTPVNVLMDLPVCYKLQDTFMISDEESDKLHIINKTVDETAFCTLIDVIDAIMWEISFYGPPSKRDDTIEEINKAIKEKDFIPLDWDSIVNSDDSLD